MPATAHRRPIAGCSISMRSAKSFPSVPRHEVDPQMTQMNADKKTDAAPTLRPSATSADQPRRTAGVLLHPTSLPGRFGIGDLGDELLAFLDWAQSAGQRVWQVLPLNAPGYGNSPYGCLSSYAGNPLLISPQRLLDEGLLPSDALDDFPEIPDDHIDFDRVQALKHDLLQRSYDHFAEHASAEQRQ